MHSVVGWHGPVVKNAVRVQQQLSMWKQVNNLLGQLSPYRSHYHKRNGSEGADDAGLELSVRQATPAATELKPVIGRASHAAATAWPVIAGETSTNVYADHPLEAASRHETAQPADQAPAAADFVSSNTTTHTSHDHAATRQGSTSSGSGSADTLLTCLLSQQWYQELAAQPSSARLVLSMIWQLAADSSLQQQQLLLAKLRKIVDVGTWQEAFGICKDALVLRALVQHVCPGTSAALADGSWQHLLQETAPQGSLAAQFVSTTATLAEAWACDSQVSGVPGQDAAVCMQQLESCILLGCAVQLQQQLQDGWGCLDQLAARLARQDGDEHARPQQQQQQQQQGQGKEVCAELQQAVAVCWPVLQAWVATTLEAGCLQGPDPQHCQDGQQQPSQWDQLLAVLKHLQQQVQGAVSAAVHPNPLQQDVQAASSKSPQAVPAEPTSSSGSSAAVSSSSLNPSTQALADEHSRCLQARQQALLELCSTVPPLLQPRDLAGSLEPAAGAPDSLVLVALMRLAAATHHLWQPLLAAAASTTHLQAAAAAAAADAGLTVHPTGTQAPNMPRLQLEPVLAAAADGTQSTADVWRSPNVQQIAAALADGPAVAAPISAGDASALRSPRSSWPDELLSNTQLWPGEVDNEDDAAAITREERTLRCWINSVLHRNAHAAASQQGLLAQTFSVDSGVRAQGPVLQPSAAPFRTLSLGGAAQGAQSSPLPAGPLAVPLRRSSASGDNSSSNSSVFRTSSACAAALAVQPPGDAASSSAAHSRSISADAAGSSAGPYLDGWCAEPAAPGTPTSTPAAGTGLGLTPHSSNRVGGSAVVVPSITSVSSLFGAELRSGVLLLEILELLQPGCVDWRLANRPPFVSRTAQLKALENCQLALKIAKDELGLPLVSMSPRDIVLGRRKIILSLVYQLMRYNTMQLLESISAVHQEQRSSSRRTSTTGGSKPSTPVAAAPVTDDDSQLRGAEQQLPPSGLPSARQAWAPVNFRSSSRKQRRQVAITEQDILDWANGKLQLVKPLAGSDFATATPVIRSFKDPVLSSGVVLLQLLHVLAPDLVDRAFVTPGHTAEQRQSNARYALSLADKMGCSLFLVWEDLVDPPQPRMVLVLLASLMYQDLQRQQTTQVPA